MSIPRKQKQGNDLKNQKK